MKTHGKEDNEMGPKERMHAIRIIEKTKANPELAKKLGIEIKKTNRLVEPDNLKGKVNNYET